MKNIFKIIFALFLLPIFLLNQAQAQNVKNNNACIALFHKIKDHSCVIEGLKELNIKEKSVYGSTTLTGFLTLYFTDFPNEKENILSQKFDQYVGVSILRALKNANLHQDYLKYLQNFNDSSSFQDSLSLATPLAFNEKIASFNSYEQWVGAYQESGDSKYIEYIIKSADYLTEKIISDSYRLTFLRLSTFSKAFNIRGKDANYFHKFLCMRYNCTSIDQNKFKHVAFLSEALYDVMVMGNYTDSLNILTNQLGKNQNKMSKIFLEEILIFQKYTNLSGFNSGNIEDDKLRKFYDAYENFDTKQNVEIAYDNLTKKQ